MTTLYLDLETRSPVPIKHGVFAYALKADILLCAWAIDGGEVTVEEWDGDVKRRLDNTVARVDRVVIHNSMFDCTILKLCAYLNIPLRKVACTMARARRHGLPGGLDKLCELLRVPYESAKEKEGKKYIDLFCCPQKKGKDKGQFYDKTTHPAEWVGFKSYAKHDITSMREVDYRLPSWNDQIEHPFWMLDQIINARGFLCDEDLAAKMIVLCEADKKKKKEWIKDQTDGDVSAGTQRDKLLAHILEEYGVDLPDCTASTLETRLKDDLLPDEVKELIRVRLESSRTSTAKYKRLLEGVSPDGRLRGTKVYCGAHPGRWSGQKFQPDNMPRPRLPQARIDLGIDLVKADLWELMGTEPTSTLAADAVRGELIAPEGKQLLVSDLSSIEARTVAWVAGEQWVLDAFARQDAGGPDLYVLTFARAFGLMPDEVTPAQRQVGKVMMLMLGYGGGVAAFVTGAATYRLNLEDLVKGAWHTFSKKMQTDAKDYYRWAVRKKKDLGLPEDVFCTCWALMKLWRLSNPNIVNFWADIEAAVLEVLKGAGPQTVGRVVVDKRDSWVRVLLPSGRYLCYPGCRFEKGRFTYIGTRPYTHQLGRRKVWGGTWTENISMGIARDQLACGLFEAETIGIEPVMHVHDEGICEASMDRDPEELAQCLTIRTPWNEDLPLSAKAFATFRY